MGFHSKLTKAPLELISPRVKGVPPTDLTKALNTGREIATLRMSWKILIEKTTEEYGEQESKANF